MRLLLLSIACLCLTWPIAAQRKTIPAEQAVLYEYDRDQVIDKFEREHIPLDGAAVKYIPFRKDDLYGFVDKITRESIIEPKFKQVFAVYPEGAIVANQHGRYGLIGYDGNYKIPPAFKNLLRRGNIYHGIISGHVDTTYPEGKNSTNFNLLFDENGKFLMKFDAHKQGDFVLDDSLAWYRFGPDYSVYNRKGKVIKTFKYDAQNHFCGIFNNILVFAKSKPDSRNYVYQGYDVLGKLTFSIPYPRQLKMMFRLNDTLYGAMSDDGLMFIDKKGDRYPFQVRSYAVGFGFEHLLPAFYSREYITVQHDETNKFGLMRRNGAMQLPMNYHFLGTVHLGEVAFLDSATKQIGFMDMNGKVTVAPAIPYDNMSGAERADQPLIFQDDLCLSFSRFRFKAKDRVMTQAPHFDYYDRAGKIALSLPDSIILATHFSDGLAAVVVEGGKLGFIDKKGKLVIPFKYELAMQGAYPMPEIVLPEFKNGFAYLKAFKGYIDKKGNEYFSGKRMKDHYNFSH